MINQRWAFMPILTGKMDKVNLPFFYQLGVQLNPLTKMTAETGKRIDILIAAMNAQGQVDWLVKWSGSGLSVCLSSARSFIDATDKVINWYKTTSVEERQKDDFSVNMQFQSIIDKAKIFETVLSEELVTLSTYSASKKGAYLTSDLIEKAEIVFPLFVLNRLNKAIVQEVRRGWEVLGFRYSNCIRFSYATSN